jgi:hypothetical protein
MKTDDAQPSPRWNVPEIRYATRLFAATLMAAAISACVPTSTPQTQAAVESGLATQLTAPPGIDHVILAIDSLERGIALLRDATGLTATYGGAHPGGGTQNALLGLGPGVYLELLAPNPQDAAGATRVAEFAGYRTLTPVGWAMGTSNADSLSSHLVARGAASGTVIAGSRQRPDGAVLRWRIVNPWPGVSRLVPFFIEWDAASPHPSTDAQPGCTLAAMSLASPAADSLHTLLGHAAIQILVSSAPGDAMSVTLDCPTGRLQFPPA